MTQALVGDIGGTHARFAVAVRGADGRIRLDQVRRYATAGGSFETRLAEYLATLAEPPALGAFGAAGPVEEGRVELLNSGWRIEAASLQGRFGFRRTGLFNDFAAMAKAAPELSAGDLEILHAGEPQETGARVVGGPGTGFGLAVLTAGPDPQIVSGEGGHRAFAPQTPLEWEVRRVLSAEFDYVSLELVAAGRFQAKVHAAVCEVLGVAPQAQDAHAILPLAQAGNEGALAVCRLRAAATMTALGDLALLAGAARGGVFLAGGEALRLRAYMAEPAALARLYDRGPRKGYLADTPLHLIVNEDAGLIGAAAMVL